VSVRVADILMIPVVGRKYKVCCPGSGDTVDFRLSQKIDVATARRSSAKPFARKDVLPSASLWIAMPHRIAPCARCRATTRYGSTPRCGPRNT
jgi:hypothetical protein